MAFGTGTSRPSSGDGRHRRARSLITALALALLATGVVTPVAQAGNGKGLGRPDLPAQRTSKVYAVDGPGAKRASKEAAARRAVNKEQAKKATAERKATWPTPGKAVIALRAKGRGAASPSGVPVTIEPRSGSLADTGGEAEIAVHDQRTARKAGVLGVVLAATADAPGRARVSVDYSEFASAVGGGWAGRLRLVRLPACALTTPERAECRRQTPLKSDNDLARRSVSAQVSFAEANPSGSARPSAASPGATVLAVTALSAGAGASPSGTGDYSATELAASSSWEAGGSTGSFTWSHKFPLPPAAADPTPTLSLTYDSGSVDGRTSNTNNQGTPVGEGFGLTDSYIERSYGSCDDDGHKDVFDRCWTYDNARLVLNGKSSRLVKGDDSGQWRLQDDDASKVTRSTGADNGDDDGEYWTVVTGEGTKYVFGLDKLDGASDQRTNSTWTVPVFGDDSKEPGYDKGSDFADRALIQAWRWNLDHVESPQGNAATYWYAKETNYYKKNKSETADAAYTRGGYLKEIKYGLRKDALFTDDADAKVTFGHAERCIASDCSELNKDTARNWPDVPFDALCSDGDKECNAAGPAFFTRKRVTGVHTFSWSAADKIYKPVDSWAFTQEYLDGGDIGDSSDHTLTLKSLKRTAEAGSTSIASHSISFTYQMRPNRVDGTEDVLPLSRPRILTVTSETGALTTVTLSSPECLRSEVKDAAEDTNTRSCYPQYWNINGAENASVDWFHKYRVLAVVTTDPAGQNDAVEHAYEYAGAAWHYSDDPFTPKAERTWADWRGYRQVTVYTGAKGTTRSKTVSLYMQGMDKDEKADGTTRPATIAPVPVSGLSIATLDDSDQYAGQLRQQIVYAGTEPVSVTVADPWSKETARQTVPDAADHTARYVRAGRTTTYTYLTGSKTWRTRAVATTYDDYGMPVTVDDSGDAGRNGDETCARTWYARNDKAGIAGLKSRVRQVGRPCSVADAGLALPAGSGTRGDVLSDTATVFDNPQATGWTADQAPTKGNATWSGRATGYPAKAGADGQRLPSGWQTVSTTAFDALGRTTRVTDADKKSTVTEYTPADAGPLTKTVAIDPKNYKTTSFLDPRRGLAERTYDANLKKTELEYDALGRLVSVWLPNRSKAAEDAPSSTFDYQLNTTKASWVSTSTLKADGKTYNTTYNLYDAQLRPLQTQSPTPLGGRILTDTRYDSRGLADETYADIFDSGSTPTGSYNRAEYGESATQTAIGHDGAGRETERTVSFYGQKRWTSTTTYTGDSTATTALEHGSAKRTIVDARGRTVETREYVGPSPEDKEFGGGLGAAYTSVRTSYTLDDKESTIVGPDTAKWTYEYDLFGRRTRALDPDKGEATTEYNALDQVVSTTDGRRTEPIMTEYDELGRITGTWAGSKTDANRLTEQTYDTVLKGRPAASIRYVNGAGGDTYTRRVTEYDGLDRPVVTQLELPAGDPLVKAGAPSTLEFSSYYNIDGTLQYAREPALGGLSAETVSRGYTGLGQVKAITGSTGYLLGTDYSALGQPQQLILGTADTEAQKKVYVAHTYEEGTGRLISSQVTDQTHPYMLQDLDYSYDEAGNVTSISDPATLGGTGKAETQCFAYDGHRRLTEAWTPASQQCDDTRSADALGGPAPYWTGYTYDDAGQRTSETEHKSTGDTRTAYCYASAQKHTLIATTAAATCDGVEEKYAHDDAGNMTTRPGAKGPQSLAWSPEGKLAKLTEGADSTDYLYDGDGNLLIRDAGNGERILYAGATELHLRKDGTTWAQRYYGTENLTVAVRTNQTGANKLHYLTGDEHGTSSVAIASDTQAVTKRYMTVFGAERKAGAVGSWIDDRAFLGKTHDSGTGLTHLDAREYDPALGLFLSADPLLEPAKHQSLNGYGYAENNPATFSDPTGRASVSCTMGVDCSTGALMSDMFAAPPFPGSGNYGSAPTSSQGLTGFLPTAPLLQPPPLLLGPDPLPVQFSQSPEMKKIQKMLMDAQAMCRPQSGGLIDSFGGDGKVKSGGPWSLAFRWIWGDVNGTNQSANQSYDEDDELTQMLIKSSSMKDARVQTAQQFAATGDKKGRADYSTTKTRDKEDLNLLQMAGVYVSDLGGLVISKEDRAAQGVLGSYALKYTVTKSTGNSLTVNYHAWTDINNESFIPSHAKWQEGANKAPRYMGGYFAGFRVDINWQEKIYK
ncbi:MULTISPECIES: RHS repeat-associated core domain-containing protein [unclassified Streptomyces]|uniref:RHS repeat-associated core domain-containing protein n=1 Tax=unclassified Streptomyces TaxID=2593676 RepID=UPI0032538EBE